jgi:hypothetical protein
LVMEDEDGVVRNKTLHGHGPNDPRGHRHGLESR